LLIGAAGGTTKWTFTRRLSQQLNRVIIIIIIQLLDQRAVPFKTINCEITFRYKGEMENQKDLFQLVVQNKTKGAKFESKVN